MARSDWDEVEETLRALARRRARARRRRASPAFDEQTELFGALPEFDSMAVATLLTGIEERIGVLIEDDDVDAEDFSDLRDAAGVRSSARSALAC